MLSSRNSVVLGLIFKSLFHFELNFVHFYFLKIKQKPWIRKRVMTEVGEAQRSWLDGERQISCKTY